MPHGWVSFAHTLAHQQDLLSSSLPHTGCITVPLLPRRGGQLGCWESSCLQGWPCSLAQGAGVGWRAAWQETFLTPGLCSWRTLELSRCTAVILVLALSSWAGSRHSKPIFRSGARRLSRSLRQEWSPRVIYQCKKNSPVFLTFLCAKTKI